MTGADFSANWGMMVRRLSGWVRTIPASKVRRGVAALMVVWILYGAAQLLMNLLPESVEPRPAAVSEADPAAPAQARELDIAALQSLNLFGEGSAEAVVQEPATGPAEEPIEAEKTQLNLTLEGIVYSPRAEDSAAVIVHRGQQETYAVGDKIPVGNQVSVAQVLLDRVILNNNGNYEALWLYDQTEAGKGAASPAPSRQAPAARVSDMRGDQAITRMAANYRDRVLNNPTSLAEVIRITPAKQDGAMVGYRISPGRDRQQFEALGLKPNDVVVNINDIDLDEPSNALEVYKLMRTATEANFTIERDGERMDIQVSLGNQ